MNEDDRLLMVEINAHADRAERKRDQMIHLSSVAAMLHAHFDHREEDDILEQLKTVFRARELFWRE